MRLRRAERSEAVNEPRAILFVGPVFSGKSAFLEVLVESLTTSGLTIGGFVQRGVFDEEGRKVGYELVGLSSGTRQRMAWRGEGGTGWRFDEAAFATARNEMRPGADLVVIDEVGWLELDGRGHAAALARAFECAPVVLLVVREALADRVRQWLSPQAQVIPIRFETGRNAETVEAVRSMIIDTAD